jgi:hypothetical protein
MSRLRSANSALSAAPKTGVEGGRANVRAHVRMRMRRRVRVRVRDLIAS